MMFGGLEFVPVYNFQIVHFVMLSFTHLPPSLTHFPPSSTHLPPSLAHLHPPLTRAATTLSSHVDRSFERPVDLQAAPTGASDTGTGSDAASAFDTGSDILSTAACAAVDL